MPVADPLGGLRGRGRGQNETFLEYGHIAYQIKWNNAYSNMVANILPTDTPLTLGSGLKSQTFFLKEVMSHIKFKVMECRAQGNQTHPQPLGWDQKVKFSTCSEYGHVAYQIKGNDACSNMVANICPSTHP